MRIKLLIFQVVVKIKWEAFIHHSWGHSNTQSKILLLWHLNSRRGDIHNEKFRKIPSRDKLWWELWCATQTVFSEGLVLGAPLASSLELSVPSGMGSASDVAGDDLGRPTYKDWSVKKYRDLVILNPSQLRSSTWELLLSLHHSQLAPLASLSCSPSTVVDPTRTS